MSRSQRVARNLVTVFAAQFIGWAFTFILNRQVPGYLGAAILGQWNAAIDLTAMIVVWIPLGTSTVLIREIARHPYRTGELLSAAYGVRVLTGTTAVLVTLFLIALLHNTPLVNSLILISLVGSLFGLSSEPLSAALQGQERIARSSLAGLVERGLYTAIVLLLIWLKASVVTIAAVGILTTLLSLCINWNVFRALVAQIRPPDWASMRLMALTSLPFFMPILFVEVYARVDSLVLWRMTDFATVGCYKAGSRPFTMSLIFPVLLVTVLLPTLTRLYVEDEIRFVQLLRRALNWLLILVVPLTVPMILLPNEILFGIFHWPRDQYARAVAPMIIYGIGCVFWFVTQVPGKALIAMGSERKLVLPAFFSMLLTIGGCLVLVPLTQKIYGNGGIGAATTDVLVEVFMTVALFAAVPRHFFSFGSIGIFLKAVLAIIPMVILLKIIPTGLGTIFALIVGALLYGLLCFLLKCIDIEDIAMLRDMVARRAEN